MQKESKPASSTHKLQGKEVRTGQSMEKSELVRGTHKLEKVQVVTSQDIE
jgi:hypothetical protein